jgi:hypothetical protein
MLILPYFTLNAALISFVLMVTQRIDAVFAYYRPLGFSAIL